jgi:hypothetical protein
MAIVELTNMTRKNNPGAGRPKLDMVRVSHTVTKVQAEYLATLPNASQTIRSLLEDAMSKKFVVQHVGYPTTGVTPDMWKTYSEHLTESAAWKAVERATAHWEPGQWDDHYRVIAPDGTQCDRHMFYDQIESKRMWKEYAKSQR